MAKLRKVFFPIFLSLILVWGFLPYHAYADSSATTSTSYNTEATQDSQEGEDASGQTGADNQNASSSQGEVTGDTSNASSSSADSDRGQGDSDESTSGQSAMAYDAEDQAIDQNETEDPAEEQPETLELASSNRDVIPDGDYVISSALNQKQVIDVTSASKKDGANVQSYTSNMTGAQKWRVSHDEYGYVIFTNLGSGKVLDVTAAKTSNKTNVQQYTSNDTLAQRWIVVKASDGNYKIVSALKSDMVLDINGASTKNGANVQIYQDNSTNAQRFVFYSLSPSVSPCNQLIEDGYYEVASTINESYRWDISGASLSNGGNAQLYQQNGTNAQIFKFTYIDGYYLIEVASGLMLDVSGANIVEGTNIQQYQPNGTDAQLWSVVDCGDSYTFISKANGLAVDVAGGQAKNSANLQCSSFKDSSTQQFTLKKKIDFLTEGTYTMQSGVSSSKVVDVASASRNSGANVQLYQSNGTQAQKWQVKKVSDQTNTYTIQSIVSGKYLAMDSNGNVCQRDATADGSQYWIAGISGGKNTLTNQLYNKVLDVKSAGTANGTNIQGYEANGTKAQQFAFVSTTLLNNGMYVIRSAQNSNQVIDVKSGSKDSGANVQSYSWNKTGAQKWNITRNSDGTYTIVNAQSGKALDVKAAQTAAGTNVQQYTKNSTAAQKWELINNGDGTFKFASALDNAMVLTIAGTPSNGVNVCINNDTGAANQRFTFETTTYNPMPADQQAMLNKIKGNSSGTQWLIAVNRSTHKVGVFKGSANNWSLQYYWSCVTGAPSTPTITGTFRTTGYKKTVLSTDSRARWCTQIRGGYYFHTILASENELGKSLSHGCIRMSYSSAQWIYNNIYVGTTVVIYN